jgi:hypothetical protein
MSETDTLQRRGCGGRRSENLRGKFMGARLDTSTNLGMAKLPLCPVIRRSAGWCEVVRWNAACFLPRIWAAPQRRPRN